MRTIHRDIVSAVILSKDGKVFHGKRDPAHGGVYPDCWQIPGGGIEAGEDKVTALKREVMEETRIDIAPYPIELVHESTGSSEKTLRDTGERVFVEMNFFTYLVTIDKLATEIGAEATEEFPQFNWFATSELKDVQLSPPSIELFSALGYL